MTIEKLKEEFDKNHVPITPLINTQMLLILEYKEQLMLYKKELRKTSLIKENGDSYVQNPLMATYLSILTKTYIAIEKLFKILERQQKNKSNYAIDNL